MKVHKQFLCALNGLDIFKKVEIHNFKRNQIKYTH